jgi:hypothetical protein
LTLSGIGTISSNFFIHQVVCILAPKLKFYFMKRLDLFKVFIIVLLFGATSSVMGQVHPLAFGPHTLSGGTTLSNSNWYKDYVGARVTVTAPVALAGPVPCKAAAIGASSWPDIVWTSIVNEPVVMGTTCDSFGGLAFTPGSMTGKIALIWRGPISGGCYTGPGSTISFALKAWNAQNAGADAIVIINEYPGQEAAVPGYTAGVGTIHIPVIMIGNLEGIAIASAYRSSPAGTVKMTLSPWGLGLNNDLGFVPNGQALYHDYAIPAGQLVAGAGAFPYKMCDGAFIANFGLRKATHTKLKNTLSFTPTGGSSSVQHVDSLVFNGNFFGAGTTDTLTDSIMAMFPTTSAEYNLTATTAGKYDLTSTISSDSLDQNLSDNTVTNSFYVTDSLFSKGRYDFVKKGPISSEYVGYSSGGELTWGDMFYVAQGGNSLKNIQYSLSSGKATLATDLIGSNDIYVFSWVDGSGTTPADSLVQDGELTLISWTTHAFVAGTDTSGGVITQSVFNDSADLNQKVITLSANTWYYVAIDIPAASGDTNRLGVDGSLNPYPRVFGRNVENAGYIEYSNFPGVNAGAFLTNPAQAESPLPFAQVSFVTVVDSFSWTSVQGLIPSIAMTTTTHPTLPAVSHVGVNQVKSFGDLTLYPNPATDHMDVSIGLDHMANSVTYKVIDGLGKTVSITKHENVTQETFSMNTAFMHAGTYYLLISADGTHTSKKFTVIK